MSFDYKECIFKYMIIPILCAVVPYSLGLMTHMYVYKLCNEKNKIYPIFLCQWTYGLIGCCIVLLMLYIIYRTCICIIFSNRYNSNNNNNINHDNVSINKEDSTLIINNDRSSHYDDL